VAHEKKGGVKERVVEELKAFWAIAIYLWVFLGSFAIYRRLISAEIGVPYLNVGFAFIESLIIAKVVLIGRMFAFTRRYEDRPLIVPTLYKSLLFGGLVVAFTIVERLVEGWLHREGLLGGLRSFADLGLYEVCARVLMLIVAFVPFFAFGEIGRVFGVKRLTGLFFSGRSPSEESADALAGNRKS
jgi:hypothetical protein